MVISHDSNFRVRLGLSKPLAAKVYCNFQRTPPPAPDSNCQHHFQLPVTLSLLLVTILATGVH